MNAVINSIRGHGRPLENYEIQRLAPSVFADTAAPGRSHRYTFIPTSHAVDALRNEGFLPVYAGEARSRKPENFGYTRHVVRFRRQDGFGAELAPEIVLLNSHDGTSSYQLSAGIFRTVCSNGLIVADSTFETIRTRHSGNVVDDVIEGAYRVIENSELIGSRVEEFRSVQLTDGQQLAFAKSALRLRWDDEAPIQGEDLLRLRRSADRLDDAWTVYNRVQENLIKGGLRGRNANGGRTTTRAVNSVSENVRLNKALWSLTEALVDLVH